MNKYKRLAKCTCTKYRTQYTYTLVPVLKVQCTEVTLLKVKYLLKSISKKYKSLYYKNVLSTQNFREKVQKVQGTVLSVQSLIPTRISSEFDGTR